tara:strand:- start:207 stop:815 length:609 start_codon:yes stop_codon:yes gene_type:complete
MASTQNKTNINSNKIIWNEKNALWYADQYGDHISNELTINSIPIDPNDILLDIGCGIGTAAKIAAKRCKNGKVYGVDPIETMIKIAKKDQLKNSNIEFSIGTAEKIPLQNEYVNKIISINSIHHWSNYKKGLSEVKRVLISDGLFFISSDIINNNDCGHGPGPLQTTEHIIQELDIAGFKDIKLRNYSLDDGGIHLVRCKKE